MCVFVSQIVNFVIKTIYFVELIVKVISDKKIKQYSQLNDYVRLVIICTVYLEPP